MESWKKVAIGLSVALALTVCSIAVVGAYAVAGFVHEVRTIYYNAKHYTPTQSEKKNLLTDDEKKDFKAMVAWVARMQELQRQQAEQRRQQQQRMIGAAPASPPPVEK
jgi:hypothetical protein